MTITSKDLTLLAVSLRNIRPMYRDTVAYSTWSDCVRVIAHTCQTSNVNVSITRFKRACEDDWFDMTSDQQAAALMHEAAQRED